MLPAFAYCYFALLAVYTRCLQVMMGLELTDKSPFKVIYLHGLVRDGEVSTYS
jgi:hypothetical protein